MHCLYAKEVVALINRRHFLLRSMPDPLVRHHALLVPIPQCEDVHVSGVCTCFWIRVRASVELSLLLVC